MVSRLDADDLVVKLRENGGGMEGLILRTTKHEIRPVFDVAVVDNVKSLT
jgi:hypothetical protein